MLAYAPPRGGALGVSGDDLRHRLTEKVAEPPPRLRIREDEVGAGELLLLRHLRHEPSGELALRQLGGEPLTPHILRGGDEHDEVEELVHATLKEKRHLGDDHAGTRQGCLGRLPPSRDPLPYTRVEQRLEPEELPVVGEDDPRHGASVDLLAAHNALAETLADGVGDLGVPVELVHDVVGRDHLGAELTKVRECRRLARPHAAGQADPRNKVPRGGTRKRGAAATALGRRGRALYECS